MKHFGLTWNLPERWILNYRFLLPIGARVQLIRVEQLFSNTSSDYYQALAKSMSRGSFCLSSERLMSSSPAFMQELPGHATGEFRNSFFAGYGECALKIYHENFSSIQKFFYGD